MWLFYCCFFKYGYYTEEAEKIVEAHSQYLPHPALILYAIGLSLFWILFYRLVMPWILNRKKYWLLLIGALLFIAVVSVVSNYAIGFLFKSFNTDKILQPFYNSEFDIYRFRLQQFKGYSLEILFSDLIAFSSIGFMRFAFENEQKKKILEQQNIQLQLDTLKAQINPHFLFNTLNTIYGKSLVNSSETPEAILRLSDMMRYILYESDTNKVSLEKEVIFIENFLMMEKQRFADMQLYFSAHNIAEQIQIAPLIFLPFAENTVKHGAQHYKSDAIITCNISINKNQLLFMIENEVTENNINNKTGCVGLNNVKARLQLYYPGKHKLDIVETNGLYRVNLVIDVS